MSLFRPDASIFPCTSASAELCGLPRWGLLDGDLDAPGDGDCEPAASSGRSEAISRDAGVPDKQQLSQHVAADALA
jgi:hypothetical protein